jgi:predicted DNA-binding protein YlxM (UPF0122 family)
MIANGVHEGITAEDWIDRNQLKAEAAELFDISRQAVHKALSTEPSKLEEKVDALQVSGMVSDSDFLPLTLSASLQPSPVMPSGQR